VARSARDRLWERVYHTARNVYTPIPGYEDFDARLTADAAANTWYRFQNGAWRKRRLSSVAKMPNPGNTLDCGCLLELEWVTDGGEIRGCKFAEGKVPMLWSDSQQAIYILPYMERTACVFPPRARENELASVWAKGRPAACSSRVAYNRPPMRFSYPAVQISYKSDKFTHGQRKPYIHHFGQDVVAYFSKEPFGARRAPEAIMIRGGRLSLTTHGIDG